MNSQPAFNRGSSTEIAGQIDAVAWAVFFIWVGIAMLVPVPWEWFLMGVGILILAAEYARWQMGIRIEGFWVACGVVCFAGGLWALLNLPWPLAPILIIGLGVWLLAKIIVDANR
ncbi:hypothetical protein [Bradyrhizobium sp. SZCCHNRI20481]|uniref:hypothetical protein n=1 Tax=Bradyrhizobium sp. SZCCHNRI20481 TaxID=3057286 RepID=UPI0029161B14|nr:hypothetical protein [Bradyrhizobium sp. SZCCHNRI20481]